MTTLAHSPIDSATRDQLDLFADNNTPLGSLHRADFEAACRAVADVDGWVNPNHVSAELHRRFGEIDARWYSGQWSSACSKNGFMTTHRDVLVPIDGTHSRGNSNKSLPMRQLREAA